MLTYKKEKKVIERRNGAILRKNLVGFFLLFTLDNRKLSIVIHCVVRLHDHSRVTER